MIEQTVNIKVSSFHKLIENINYLDDRDLIDWDYLSENISYDVDIELFLEIYRDRINWEAFSKNTDVKWETDLIEKYENKLDFKKLSNNPYIPFTEELILQYLDKWEWDPNAYNGRTSHKTGFTDLGGICYNPNFPINVNFIEKIEDYIDWRSLGMNKNLHIYNPTSYGGEEYVPIDIDSMKENFEVIFKYWDNWFFERSHWFNDHAMMSGRSEDSIEDNKSINWEYYDELYIKKLNRM